MLAFSNCILLKKYVNNISKCMVMVKDTYLLVEILCWKPCWANILCPTDLISDIISLQDNDVMIDKQIFMMNMLKMTNGNMITLEK